MFLEGSGGGVVWLNADWQFCRNTDSDDGAPGILVLFLEHSKNRTPVFGSILGTISVTSQICDSCFLCA
jgi:hypothetical protein